MKTKILLTCLLGSVFLSNANAQPPADPAEAFRQRLTAKVERVKEGVQTWAASGRNPSAIVKTMQETIKPLLDAGKASEAEAELDRLLEQLKPDAKLLQPDTRPPSPGPAEQYRAFEDPKPITIRGYDGEALDPFLSRDGRHLFFNSSHFQPAKTDLHYAARMDDLTFEYKAKIGGVNTDGELEAVSSMDRDGNFFFVSPRSFKETSATIHRGKFKDGAVTDITVLRGLRLDQPEQVNFDVEVSADGNTLFTVDSDMRGRSEPRMGPRDADIAMAVRKGNGFERLDKGSELLAKVNTKENLEFASGISTDGLELFFTRFTVNAKQFGIWRAVRPSVDAPFETPQRVSVIEGYAEAPSLSPDGRSLYYHKRDGDRFGIYRVTRAAGPK